MGILLCFLLSIEVDVFDCVSTLHCFTWDSIASVTDSALAYSPFNQHIAHFIINEGLVSIEPGMITVKTHKNVRCIKLNNSM